MKWYVLLKDWGTQKAGQKIQMSDVDAKSLVDTGFAKESEVDPTESIVDNIVKNLTPKFEGLIKSATEATIKGLGDAVVKAKDTISITDPRNADNLFGYKSVNNWLAELKSASNPQWSLGMASESYKSYLGKTYGDRFADVAKSATGLQTAVGEDGGFLSLPSFAAGIFKVAYDSSMFLSKIDQYTVGGASNNMTFLQDAETSRATGSRRGGVRGYWIEEGGQYTASRPKFDKMTLTLRKLGVFVYMTEEMNADQGFGLEQYISNCAGEEIDFLLCDAIINGAGGGNPLGIMNSPAKITQTAESGQGANTVVGKNISKMWSRMHPSVRGDAVWLINSSVEPELDTLSLAIGTGGSTWPLYLPPGGLADLPYGRLKGRPVFVTEFAQQLGTEGDIILWSPKSYCSISKGGIRTAMSIHLRFDYDEMVWRFTFRFDGQPWWKKALTPFKGTNTLSTIVTLNSTRT